MWAHALGAQWMAFLCTYNERVDPTFVSDQSDHTLSAFRRALGVLLFLSVLAADGELFQVGRLVRNARKPIVPSAFGHCTEFFFFFFLEGSGATGLTRQRWVVSNSEVRVSRHQSLHAVEQTACFGGGHDGLIGASLVGQELASDPPCRGVRTETLFV